MVGELNKIMSKTERRVANRSTPTVKFNPMNCCLVTPKNKQNLQIVNYHYRGACFRGPTGDYSIFTKDAFLQFKIGTKDLNERIKFQVIWETISENGQFGVKFCEESSFVLSRAERFLVNSINTPVISGQDPLDPNRIIYLKVQNVSNTGMLLSTSMTNKHLFPGMELRGAILTIPGIGKTEVDLFIENCRDGGDGTANFGVSIKNASHTYQKLMSKYLSNLGGTNDIEDRIEKIVDANFGHKELRQHLSIKEIQTQTDYERVLKLRFSGYKLAGKIDESKTWESMGDGLKNEGIVLAASLGGQIVASCEFRLNRMHGPRTTSSLDLMQIPEVRGDNFAEINKLVVHPKAQSSDVVLGMFQKIHAIAMLNGKPDGIIFAEPKLIQLYERLGFRKTKFTRPHPTKENLSLTLMIIYSEAYSSSEGMNPYAWTIAFEETQKFFDAVGVNKTRPLEPLEHITKLFTKFILKFKRKRQKTKHAPENIKINSTQDLSKKVIDPKWTKLHLNATIMYPYVLEAQSLVGAETIHKILADFNLDVDHFKNVGNWISIDFFDEFIERFSTFGDPYTLNRNAGYKSLSKEVLGVNYFIIKHFFSPRIAFRTFEKFLPKFNKTRIYQIIDSGPNYCKIRLTNPDRSLLPKHPSAKENWFALVDGYVKTLTGSPAEIKSIKSAFDGDDYCEFIVSWKNPLFRPSYFFTAAAIGGSAFAFWKLIISNLEAESALLSTAFATLISVVAILYVKSQSLKRKYTEVVESLSDYEKHADEKYKELQSSKIVLEKSYQEGKILETINKEIQNSDELTNILQISINALCTKFEFKRAFIMIKDESGKYLRTSAVFGADENFKDLWDFRVDISVKRENALVLSSAFHSGQSILINDVSEHIFHLNETSRRLISKLDSKGFAIVPIPSSDPTNWGVLIADKGESKEIITRRDLVAIQRVSQSLGLALDKKSKLESEIRTRKIFQKYVPSMVAEKVLGDRETTLGGKKCTAYCLFFDIRNFTNLSSQLPPEILCDILNKIFDLLHKSVSKTNGVIDKFLGDGALVTWGAIPGSDATANDVLKSAIEFLNSLGELNATFSNQGLSAIDVGIGIHRGPVIAGNIGSQDRMEYTVIGSTVNIASRLEQLSKVYNCHIVISEEVIPFNQLEKCWHLKSEVKVRGLNEIIKVSIYKHEYSFEEKKAEIA